LYGTGSNKNGQLGFKTDTIYQNRLFRINFFNDNVIDFCCGYDCSYVLTRFLKIIF
jgi:alpha-tubulin suppressor-like RCC1 family protein